MPTVRILTSVAAPSWHYERGDTVAVAPEVAEDWIERGMAELVRDEEPERAVESAPERTERTLQPRPPARHRSRR